MSEQTKQSVFMQMYNGTRTGEGSFNVALKELFYKAALGNKRKLVAAFPEFFGDEVPEFGVYTSELIKGIHRIMTLCNECIGELQRGDISNRVCDLLGEEIPDELNSLFDKAIDRSSFPYNNFGNTVMNEIPKDTSESLP